MSSFIYPDSGTRKLFSPHRHTPSHTRQFYRKRKLETMMARAQRLTVEKMKTKGVVEKNFFGKVKAKVNSFLKWLFN